MIMKMKMDNDYQAESDMHSLKRAEEIRSDAKRLKAAQARAATEMKGLAKIAAAKTTAKAAVKRSTMKG